MMPAPAEKNNMRKEIDGLVETWTNGNRKDVINDILEMPKAKACVITAYVHDLLSRYDQGLFTRMLESRAEQERMDERVNNA